MMFSVLLAGLLPLQEAPSEPILFNPNRLALTPKLDGVMESEEWDPVMEENGQQTFLQWEPGALYFAGRVPEGKVLRASLDLAGDGWLVGEDNIELLIGTEVRARRLKQDAQQGGTWEDAPLIAQLVRVQSTSESGLTTFEVKMLSLDDRLFNRGRSMLVRLDAIAADAVDVPGYLPRRLFPIRLALDRSQELPEGVSWSPDVPFRSVVPGESIRMRLAFRRTGDASIGRVDLRTMGLAAMFGSNLEMPFPTFDGRGRAAVDYTAKVAPGAPFGFTRLVARLQRPDGGTALVETSYQIADVVSIEPELRVEPGKAGTPRILRGDVLLRSNTRRSLRGKMFFDMPEGWALRRGNDAEFRIWRSRDEARMRVELVSPPDSSGLVPIPIRVVVGDRTIERTAYVVIP